MKSVPSGGTSQHLLFIEGTHVDVAEMHDGLSKLTAYVLYRGFNKKYAKIVYFLNKQVIIRTSYGF